MSPHRWQIPRAFEADRDDDPRADAPAPAAEEAAMMEAQFSGYEILALTKVALRPVQLTAAPAAREVRA